MSLNVIAGGKKASAVTISTGTAIAIADMPATTGTTGQVTVGASATLVVAANAGRRGVLLTNFGTVDVYYGFNSSVTVGNGQLLVGAKGAAVGIPYSGIIYAICATSQVIGYADLSN